MLFFPMLLAAKPWFYWIAPVLVLSAVLAVIATILGYYVKVTSNKYPRK